MTLGTNVTQTTEGGALRLSHGLKESYQEQSISASAHEAHSQTATAEAAPELFSSVACDPALKSSLHHETIKLDNKVAKDLQPDDPGDQNSLHHTSLMSSDSVADTAVFSEDFVEAPQTVADLTSDTQLAASIVALAAAAEEDPPLLFSWLADNILRFILKVESLAPGGPLPPFPLPNPLSVDSFKAALVQLLRTAVPGTAHPIDDMCLPATVAQLAKLTAICSQVEHHRWFAAVDAVILPPGAAPPGPATPFASLYTLRPRATKGELDSVTAGRCVQPAILLWQ